MERINVFVLIDLFRGNLPCDNSAKQARHDKSSFTKVLDYAIIVAYPPVFVNKSEVTYAIFRIPRSLGISQTYK
jgi:hypothetical protein